MIANINGDTRPTIWLGWMLFVVGVVVLTFSLVEGERVEERSLVPEILLPAGEVSTSLADIDTGKEDTHHLDKTLS